ncbi:MAG: hypothetical protein R3B96_05555 [Pirellulaceae bacterium]
MAAESDGLHVWIDTRDTHDPSSESLLSSVHGRARLAPGKAGIDPYALALPINRTVKPPRQ